ncbi:uncharacterized protein LOC129608610, partial [Condylostylus longicornis]|uniref:uncharacterized protein LOC129608610 n=1 Tax=Condylostylus longicornis TaxID=2530218 RepID=UPI00244DE5BD
MTLHTYVYYAFFYLFNMHICMYVRLQRSFRIIFTSSEAKFDKDLLEVKIDIRNNSNEESVLNAKLNILQQLDDLEISYGLAMQLQTQNYTTTISRSLHLCNFFKDHSLDPFLRFIYEGLVTHGNLMKSCPIQKGVYFVREYKIDEELFPSYVPETNFLATLGISKRKKTNSVQILLIKVNVKIDKSKGYT